MSQIVTKSNYRYGGRAWQIKDENERTSTCLTHVRE